MCFDNFNKHLIDFTAGQAKIVYLISAWIMCTWIINFVWKYKLSSNNNQVSRLNAKILINPFLDLIVFHHEILQLIVDFLSKHVWFSTYFVLLKIFCRLVKIKILYENSHVKFCNVNSTYLYYVSYFLLHLLWLIVHISVSYPCSVVTMSFSY